MKKIELLTLSIVTATLIVATGCSDDDDTKQASGPSAPSESSTPVELNESVARNAVALIFGDSNGIRPAPKRGISFDSNSSQNGTSVRDCDIEGEQTTHTSSVNTDLGNGNWSVVEVKDITYDNCIDVSDSPAYDTITKTGYDNSTVHVSYDAETSWVTEEERWDAHYTFVSENNTTKESNTDNYSITEESTLVYEEFAKIAIVPKSAQVRRVDPRKMVSMHEYTSGEVKNFNSDEDGNVTDGFHAIVNITIDGEYVNSGSTSQKLTFNGFSADYDMNSSGEKLTASEYYNNYVIHWYRPDPDNANEQAIKVSGTIGDLCLGGSITITTDPVIHSNQSDYKDKNDASGHSVLPYSGVQQISGSNDMSITFDYNTTMNTSATVKIGDTSMTYGTWSELLAGSSCNAD